MVMLSFLCLVGPAVCSGPAFDIAVNSAPPCGYKEWIGGYANYTNSSPNFGANTTDMTIGVYAAYDCLCGNRNTMWIQDCRMGSTCMRNGACMPACLHDSISTSECACARGPSGNLTNVNAALASEYLVACSNEQVCVGPFATLAPGTCVDQCQPGIKAVESCGCEDQGLSSLESNVNYCVSTEVCFEGSCLSECQSDVIITDGPCACSVNSCVNGDTCVGGECVKPCSSTAASTGPCMCGTETCSSGDICENPNSAANCVPECTDSLTNDCWCGADHVQCNLVEPCYNGSCVALCGENSAEMEMLYPDGLCTCGTTVCGVDKPWCANGECFPNCLEEQSGTFCKCLSLAYCTENQVCSTTGTVPGACIAPPPAPRALI